MSVTVSADDLEKFWLSLQEEIEELSLRKDRKSRLRIKTLLRYRQWAERVVEKHPFGRLVNIPR